MNESVLHEQFKENMRELLGSEYEAFLNSLSQEPVKAVRINTLKTSDVSLFPFLCEKVSWAENGFYCEDIKTGGLWQSITGLIYSQDASAMAPVEALNVCPGDKVLDLCAAPGGKSTQIAQKLRGNGLLVANEIVPQRSKILFENIKRLGISNAVVLNENPQKLESRFSGYFDKILVDAPCSGEGMFRKDSEAAEMWTPETNAVCAERQLKILNSAKKMLKPGGRLVYSTCTFSKTENENVILKFLEENMDFEIAEHCVSGIEPGFSPLEKSGRIFPHRQKGEGHFLAALKKLGGETGNTADMKTADKKDTALYRDFEKEFFCGKHYENVYISGSRVYVCDTALPDLTGLKWLCGGVYAGENKKGRFEPEHHLAIASKKSDFKYAYELTEEEFKKYIFGETVRADISGWCAACFRGFPAGLGKGSGGIIKNHYPKSLRRKI